MATTSTTSDGIPEPGDLLTPGQVAAAFGVDAKTVARWAKNGNIPPSATVTTPGGTRRYRRTAILALLNGGQR